MHGSETENMKDLCRRCGEGDEEAFAEAYRRFGGVLYGTALRMLKSPQDAEEVVQEVFLTLYRKAGEMQPQNLGGWLHRVTVNRSLDRIRSQKRRPEVELFEQRQAAPASSSTGVPTAGRQIPPPAGSNPDTGADGSYGFSLDIERAVAGLPERARMVFLLHDVEGFKHREIAELMEISDGSSKSQLFRARALLRDALES